MLLHVALRTHAPQALSVDLPNLTVHLHINSTICVTMVWCKHSPVKYQWTCMRGALSMPLQCTCARVLDFLFSSVKSLPKSRSPISSYTAHSRSPLM